MASSLFRTVARHRRSVLDCFRIPLREHKNPTNRHGGEEMRFIIGSTDKRDGEEMRPTISLADRIRKEIEIQGRYSLDQMKADLLKKRIQLDESRIDLDKELDEAKLGVEKMSNDYLMYHIGVASMFVISVISMVVIKAKAASQ